MSEAVGTVLLLGISITLAGGIAVWTSNIEEGEEGIYVDLWADVQGSDLVIVHRGGDHLDGGNTRIIVADSSGYHAMENTYYVMSGTNDETWSPGEELVIDITNPAVTDTFNVIVTTTRTSGESLVILNNELQKTGSTTGLPDLAITLINFKDADGNIVNTILDNGAYNILVRVSNFGSDMTSVHHSDMGNGEISNLRLFDSNDPIDMQSVSYDHYTTGDVEVTGAGLGIMNNGDYMIFNFTWQASTLEPRSLGLHRLNVKVIPVYTGELNYRNNYIEKKFNVDKELTPLDIHGPDPGIYDILFSNEAPNSGEEVTVTVIIQNSGDEPIIVEDGVNLIVTTWEPERYHDTYQHSEIHDWRMDYPGYYGQWRSEYSEEIPVTEDDTFPTCVRTDIELLPGAYLFFYFTLEARVDVPGGEQWVFAAIDAYNDNSQPQGIAYYPGGDDPGDNMRLGKIQVLPRILVVDDDGSATGTEGDMTSTLLEALVGAGVTVDKIFVSQEVSDQGNTRDAPAFTYNQDEISAPAMEDYDIVMWVTGYDTDPLTNVPTDPITGIGGNIQEIMEYLDSNRYFLLVGTDPFNGLMTHFASTTTTDLIVSDDPSNDASDFLYKYLGVQQVDHDIDIPAGEQPVLYGMDIYVDLQLSSLEGDLVLSHGSGDDLNGPNTVINIYDQFGATVISGTYSSFSGTSGEDWSAGTEIIIDMSTLGLLQTYDIVVSTARDAGSTMIIHRNEFTMPDTTGENPEILFPNLYMGGISSKDTTIELNSLTAGNGLMNYFVPRGIAQDDTFEIPVGTLTSYDQSILNDPKFNSVRAFGTPDPAMFDAYYRSVVLGWDITEIKHLNEKVDLFSDILKWFDWEVEVGRDLAVTRMNLYILSEDETGNWFNDPVDENNTPKYLDTVLIEAYVRNNGPNLESSSVMFYVTGPDGVELPITPNIPDPQNNLEPEDYDNPYDMNGLSGGGTEVSIFKLWLAVGVGTYTFRVVVDPFHLITEISEENNDISYSTSTITSFVTKNNILVVDDDMSSDNYPVGMDGAVMAERLIDYSLAGGEPSQVIEDTLDSLDYDFDVHVVENDKEGSLWNYSGGLSILDLKRYNSIMWIMGDSGLDDPLYRETLSDTDLEAIKRYLDGDYPEAQYLPDDHHENIIFIGTYMMEDLTVSNDEITMLSGSYYLFDLIEEYLGVQALSPMNGIGSSLVGPTDGELLETVYKGIDFKSGDLDSFYRYSTLETAAPVDSYAEIENGIWTDDPASGGDLVSVQYHYNNIGSPAVVQRYFQVIIHTWQFTRASILQDESPLRELVYLPLHWFDTPEDDPELIGRSSDILMETDNPVIGNSYVIQVEIANLGGEAGGGTIRFMDGDTLVQSENLYLNEDTTTTVEAIWTPLYAGERTITVWLDRYNDYAEVFDVQNNAPSFTIDVFFFWDDMESGDDNWDHDSTILRINGEGTLDYMAEPTNTNIENQWLAMNGFHVNTEVENTVIQDEFFSSPNSFYMYEPNLAGTSRKDIDLVMMLDTSGSMDDNGWDSSIGDYQPIGDMKIAAKNIIDLMTPSDRMALYTFDGSGSAVQRLSFTYMTQTNRDSTKDLIDGLSANGYTPLWDSIGETINYAVSNQRTTNVYTAAITLTDGDDYGRFGREDGSTVYCPGSEPSTWYGSHTWGHNLGLRWGDDSLEFRNQGSWNGQDVIRVGGQSASISGSWMDLRDSTRTGLLYSPIPLYTIGLGITPHENDPLNPIIGKDYWFTSEYDLWQIAETSKGEYYYAPDSSTLGKIFEDIFQQVEQEAQASTRGGEEPSRAAGLWTDGEELARNKYMHTNIVDLQYADEATLSFNHKYNMKVGSNGGVILIGTDTDGDGTWSFKYVQPDQPYTGNFLTSAWDLMLDDHGNKMRWCWNGLSGGGSLDWDHVTVDLEDFLGEEVIIAFVYYYLTGGTGYGWVIDDVDLKITTGDTNPNKDLSVDSWTLQNVTDVGSLPGVGSYSGYNAWFIGDPNNGGDLKPGVDNSLYTRQIDLTNARSATLQAMLRFNIDTDPGRPPDGFRVEVSTDNKQTWVPLNLGVRSSWGVSGTEADLDDGVANDTKSYTGLVMDGNLNNWVPAYTLTRLSTDLGSFTGSVINIRFRVITNTDATHYANISKDLGIYIDDVFVYGSSLLSTRSGNDAGEEANKVLLPDNFEDAGGRDLEEGTTNGEMTSGDIPADRNMDPEDHNVIDINSGWLLVPLSLTVIGAVVISVRRGKRRRD